MKSNGVAPYYVNCPACGIIAPPRSVRRPGSSNGANTTVIECAGCGEYARVENLKVAHSTHGVRCERRRCRNHFLVPWTAHLVCCPRCGVWQDGPAAVGYGPRARPA